VFSEKSENQNGKSMAFFHALSPALHTWSRLRSFRRYVGAWPKVRPKIDDDESDIYHMKSKTSLTSNLKETSTCKPKIRDAAIESEGRGTFTSIVFQKILIRNE
jgi:hypothetical protein